MSIILCSICLSDIPKERIKTGRDGKKYLNMTVSQMREPDKFDQTHTIFCSQTKEEREARADRTYLGKGKELVFDPVAATPESVDQMPVADSVDDLPF